MPHVIISGMPGIGKTTSVLCLARQMLGDSYKEAVLELNASDERGWFCCCSSDFVSTDESRYRRGTEPDQGFCPEEGYPAPRPP